MKVAIIGPGAMGCLFGYFLSKADNEVWLLDHRPKRAEEIEREGIRVETAEGLKQAKVNITVNPLDIESPELILICVKAYDTTTAAEQALVMARKGSLVLSLQNGLGNVEKMAEVLGGSRVLGGTTAQGANVVGPGHIRHAGQGETVIGELDGGTERAEKAADVLRAAGFTTRVTDDLDGLIWSKVIINVGINALTALTRLQNGRLLDYEGTSLLMEKAVTEAVKVCSKMKVRLLYPDPVARVREVAKATGENISSMLQDVRALRKTEINEINGAVVKAAKRMRISAPVNEALWLLVTSLEQSYSARVKDN